MLAPLIFSVGMAKLRELDINMDNAGGTRASGWHGDECKLVRRDSAVKARSTTGCHD